MATQFGRAKPNESNPKRRSPMLTRGPSHFAHAAPDLEILTP
jgi:hypothetical protein